MSDTSQKAMKRLKNSTQRGFFRTLREEVTKVATYGGNAVDGLIFEQRKALLKDRLVGDAEFLADLNNSAEEFGGIEACKQAHNELVSLLEELKL